MQEKESIIEELEAQVAALTKGLTPDLVKKINYLSELQELRAQVDSLSSELEKQQECSRIATIQARQT